MAKTDRRLQMPLHGFERLTAMTDNGSAKIAHVMALRGPPDAMRALLRHLPHALALTFNKHPRMRVKQMYGEFAMAEVHRAMTRASVWEDKLLEINEWLPHQTAASWEKYVEAECNLPLDSVHVHSSIPHLGPAVGMYLSSVDTMCYSMMHKYEDRDAENLFAAFMASVEQVGEVAADEAMMDVVDQVRMQLQ